MMKQLMTLAIAAIFGTSISYAEPKPAQKIAVEETTATTASTTSTTASPETPATPPVGDFHKFHATRNANILNRTSSQASAGYGSKIAKAHADAHRLALQQQNRIKK
ncbi:MAG: hypothetical protein HDR99_05270 [Bacteroides sp.]|nr:hypothetical protein [Bacteroides sp.]